MRDTTLVVAGRWAMIGARARPLCLLMALTFGCGEKDPCERELAADQWFPLGDSEYVPRSIRATNFKCTNAIGSGLGAHAIEAAMGPDGNPMVVWQEYFYDIVLKRFRAGVWEEPDGAENRVMGVTRNEEDAVYDPSVALDSAGNPIVVWASQIRFPEGTRHVYAKRYDGAHWVELAGSATDSGVSEGSGVQPAVAVGADNLPVVAWTKSTGDSSNIYLKRFDGTSWIEIGGSGSGNGVSNTITDSRWPWVAVDGDGDLIVAWSEEISQVRQLYVRRFNGATWEDLAGCASQTLILGSTGELGGKVLDMSADGSIFVAWAENRGENFEIYLSYCEGNAWVELAGSTTSGGISATASDSIGPSLDLDRDGNPVVAWSEGDSDWRRTSEIYVRRFDGKAWVEVAGSASGGGVSNSEKHSGRTALAVSDDLICVAWAEAIHAPHVNPEADPSDPDIEKVLMRCTRY